MQQPSPSLTAHRLRECRARRKETLEQVARVLGVNKSTVMRWERGDTPHISRATLNLLAQHYGVSVAWLTGHEDNPAGEWIPASEAEASIRLPILGAVRGGYGGAVFEEIVGYEAASVKAIQPGEDYCWLRVTGDSMSPLISEGDLVLIRKQPAVDNGDYAVAIIDDEEGTVKRIQYVTDGVELHSVNPYYPVRRFTGKDMQRVRILGRVMESKRKF